MRPNHSLLVQVVDVEVGAEFDAEEDGEGSAELVESAGSPLQPNQPDVLQELLLLAR